MQNSKSANSICHVVMLSNKSPLKLSGLKQKYTFITSHVSVNQELKKGSCGRFTLRVSHVVVVRYPVVLRSSEGSTGSGGSISKLALSLD